MIFSLALFTRTINISRTCNCSKLSREEAAEKQHETKRSKQEILWNIGEHFLTNHK